MSWLKRIFGKVKILEPIVRNDFEKMLLGRLERSKVFCENEGKTFYTDNENKIFKVKVLGSYRYYDVDGTVSGTVSETENGEIINVSWLTLYDKKPHEWVTYLSSSEKYQYSIRQRYDTDEELVKKFFNTLPKDVIREMKINSIINA
jgi:hypothetical protein